MKLLLSSLALLLLTGCSSDKLTRAEYALQMEGMEEIELVSRAFLGCSLKEDSWFTSYHFTAKKEDRNMSGTVCCGLLLKGCTIRY